VNRPGLVQPVGCGQVMSTGVGIALVAAGAIVRFAVPATFIHGLNPRVAGVIVMLAGVIALLLSLLVWGPLNRRRNHSGDYASGTPPLARQRTLLEVALRDREATSASLRAACERALAAGEQHERLIAALLTLARGERGLDRFEPVDLPAIAAGVLAARRDDTDAAQLSLVARIGPATAFGDPGLAERLVTNLVDNAIRYNAAGGQVEIATGTRAGRAYLAVANTGPVIPPDQLGRLFRPFQRMDPARRAPADLGHGLGLGLAIVSAVAAAHGADLRAVTRAAGGLAVEIVFPVPPAEPPPREVAPAGRIAVPA